MDICLNVNEGSSELNILNLRHFLGLRFTDKCNGNTSLVMVRYHA